MPRPFRFAVAVTATCLALAACGTPQDRCVAGVTRDLRVIDGLIGDAQVNLARGYGVQQTTVVVPEWQYCGPPVLVQQQQGGPVLAVPAGLCLGDRAQTFNRPVAIDLEAERRKLAQLQAQRDKLARQAQPAIAQCQTMYPR